MLCSAIREYDLDLCKPLGAKCLSFTRSPFTSPQGSDFAAVVIPLPTQHYVLLQRNLIYTGITRGKRLVPRVGQKKALGIAVRNDRSQKRCCRSTSFISLFSNAGD